MQHIKYTILSYCQANSSNLVLYIVWYIYISFCYDPITQIINHIYSVEIRKIIALTYMCHYSINNIVIDLICKLWYESSWQSGSDGFRKSLDSQYLQYNTDNYKLLNVLTIYIYIWFQDINTNNISLEQLHHKFSNIILTICKC